MRKNRDADVRDVPDDMTFLILQKKVNDNLLGEELFSAFPEWIVEGKTKVILGRSGNSTYIIFPRSTPIQDVQAVISAHDSKGKSKNEKEKDKKNEALAQIRDAINRAETTADLKPILLELALVMYEGKK